MSTLADQLKTLGLQPTEREVVDTRKTNSKTGGRPLGSGKKPQSDEGMLFLKLPRFGTVARLDEERGFGFISGGAREDVFFHFRGYPGRLPDGQKLPLWDLRCSSSRAATRGVHMSPRRVRSRGRPLKSPQLR